MDEKDSQEAIAEYLREKNLAMIDARESLEDYIQLCDPNYIMGAVHRLICSELKLVEEGKVKRLALSLPARHGKSKAVAIEWPSYMLGKYPHLKFIVATHSNALAQEHSDSTRARLRNPWYQEIFPTRIRDDASSVKHWKTAQGGEYHTAGVTVKLSGFGTDILIIDDMFADYAEAHSQTKRDGVFNWFQSTAQTRLSPNGAIVMIGTRWHLDDLFGRLNDPALKAKAASLGVSEDVDWRVVNLPAFAEDGDPLGRKPGEALFPERWSEKRLRMLQATMDDHVFNAMYQGRPTMIGGNYLATANFEIVEPHDVPINQRWMRAWDFAYTTNTTSDYTASLKGMMHDGYLYLADGIHDKWKWPDAKARIVLQAEMEKIPIGVEANGPQKAAVDDLRESVSSSTIMELYPAVDIIVRIQRFAVLLKNKKVRLVRGDWNSSFVAECETLPNGKHDDWCAMVAMLVEMLETGPAAVQAIAPQNHGIRPTRSFRIRM